METIPLRSKPKTINKWMISLILLLFVITFIFIFAFYPFASTKRAPYLQGKYPVLIKGKIHGNAIRNGNITYVPLTILKDQIDNTVYEENHSMIITTKLNVIRIPFNQKILYVNGKLERTSFPIIKSVGSQSYIDLETLQSVYPIQYHFTKHTRAVWIQISGDQYTKGQIVTKNVRKAYLRLRQKQDLHSPYVTEVKKGEAVHIEQEFKNYYFVRTEEGIGGYIQKLFVRKGRQIAVQIPIKKEIVSLPKMKMPIQLSWEAVYSKTTNPTKLPNMPGVNIVSPTWFRLKNANGDFSNLSSLQYMKWAKQHHIQVWALFSNSSNPDLTRAAFSTFETRQKMIRKLVSIVNKEQIDGINIDIENVRPEDGPLVTQFVRELTTYFHANHKYVSMDITFISTGNWSEFYEREKLGKVVDYLMVMAYDEHWANSPNAGSVASLPWVENSLQPILKLIPNEKIILGVPFYTRLWKEEWIDGKKNTSSTALTMNHAKDWIKEHKVKIQMDSESGQHYVEYTDSKTNVVYKMWIEDEYSLSKRADIAGRYQLAGIASWARSFANKNAWVSLQTTLSAYGKNK